MEAAGGEKQKIHRVPTKVLKAFKESKDEIIVCVETKDPGNDKNYTYNFSIPLNNIEKYSTFREKSITSFYYEPKLEEIRKNCEYTNNKMQILVYKTEDNISTHINSKAKLKSNISGNLTDAVYAIYRNETPVQLGYIANKPFYKDYRTIDVPINSVYEYYDRVNSNPVLYVLTPVAIVFDIFVTAPAAAAFFAGYCLGDGDLDCH